VSAPSALPLEARQAAWDLLWRRLLVPIPDDDEPEAGSDQDHEQDNEAVDAA
jgi:hypothetical protein